MGSKSLTIAYEAYVLREEDRVVSAESETVIVCFNTLTKQTELIPEVWKSSIKENSLMKFFKDQNAVMHFPAEEEATLSGIIVEADHNTGLATKVSRIIRGGSLIK